MDFDSFCKQWVSFCIELKNKKLTKGEKRKIKGDKFENDFYRVLLEYLPENYQIFCQKRISGIDYKFDYIFAKSSLSDIDPKDAIAAFEVKAHGFFSYKSISNLKKVFQEVKNLNPKINIFYITFRETNTYDKKAKEILEDFIKNYYRLSDSGDGVQEIPKKYFPESWDRLIKDLLKIESKLI